HEQEPSGVDPRPPQVVGNIVQAGDALRQFHLVFRSGKDHRNPSLLDVWLCPARRLSDERRLALRTGVKAPLRYTPSARLQQTMRLTFRVMGWRGTFGAETAPAEDALHVTNDIPQL